MTSRVSRHRHVVGILDVYRKSGSEAKCRNAKISYANIYFVHRLTRVGRVSQWLGRRSLTGELSLIYA